MLVYTLIRKHKGGEKIEKKFQIYDFQLGKVG